MKTYQNLLEEEIRKIDGYKLLDLAKRKMKKFIIMKNTDKNIESLRIEYSFEKADSYSFEKEFLCLDVAYNNLYSFDEKVMLNMILLELDIEDLTKAIENLDKYKEMYRDYLDACREFLKNVSI